jgi:DNA-binding LytR/AlgR family response regulator
MKVKFILTEQKEPLEVTVKGHQGDPAIEKLKTFFEQQTGFTLGKKEGSQYRIPYQDIFYIESQEEKTILYTHHDSYLSPYRLYEIEAWGDPFTRISKSVIVNLNHLQSFKPLFNSKLEASMTNGDRLEVSRMYLQEIKRKLGDK